MHPDVKKADEQRKQYVRRSAGGQIRGLTEVAQAKMSEERRDLRG